MARLPRTPKKSISTNFSAEVLEGAISLCRKRKHGHFTNLELFIYLRSKGSIISIRTVADRIQKMKNKGMFRPNLERKWRSGFVIRELKYNVWSKKPEKPEEPEICRSCMAKEATITHLKQQVYDLRNELFAIKSAWRNLHNVLKENR